MIDDALASLQYTIQRFKENYASSLDELVQSSEKIISLCSKIEEQSGRSVMWDNKDICESKVKEIGRAVEDFRNEISRIIVVFTIDPYSEREKEYLSQVEKFTFYKTEQFHMKLPSYGTMRHTAAFEKKIAISQNRKTAEEILYFSNSVKKFVSLSETITVYVEAKSKSYRSLQERASSMLKSATTNNVFLVHGHNDAVRETLARFLEHLGLQVVILHEQPNRGRTIIEKFEEHSQEAGFAVILLTGDDRGGLKGQDPSTYQLRARQNVILELGFFLGVLTRHRVCAMYEEGVEIPSDYHGVLFIKLDSDWKLKLAQELKVAGFPVDLNKVI